MIYYSVDNHYNYLAHHGILGMHWGIRRFQPYSIGYQRKGGEGGKEINLAKKASNLISNAKSNFKARSAKNKKLRNLKKARKAKEKKAKIEKAEAKRDSKAAKKREEILKKGSADEILKNSHLYDHKELDSAITRLNDEKKLRDLKAASDYATADAAKKFVDNIISYTRTGINAYSAYKDVEKIISDNSAWAKKKDKILKSGDPAKVLEIQKKLTHEEVKKVAGRTANLEKLKEYAKKAEEARARELEEVRKKPEDTTYGSAYDSDKSKSSDGFNKQENVKKEFEKRQSDLSNVNAAESKYESLSKNYKPTQSQKDFDNKMEAPYEIGHTYDGQSLVEEIKTKAGDWYHGKPIGEHSKAAIELYNSIRQDGENRLGDVEDKQRSLRESAANQALDKYPKMLRNSEMAKYSAQSAMQKVMKSKQYKSLDDEWRRVQKGNRARSEAVKHRVVAAALRDMGYPVNDDNIKKIWDYVIYD